MKDILGLILAILILLSGCSAGEEPAGEYSFFYQQTEIRMHEKAAPILEKLGEPVSYTEQTSCAFDGMDKTYCYGSFYISTYPDKDEDRIQSVWLVDDTAATKEGIRIGDTREKVEAAYGTKWESGRGQMILHGSNGKLSILLTGDVVTSIQYTAVFE